jgi:protein phosphatase
LTIEIRGAGRTHTGNVREANEDCALVDPDVGLYAVFDGMGGAMAGDVASTKARDVVSEYIRARFRTVQPRELLAAAIQAASAAVHTEASSRRDRKGMGTTVVACLVNGENTVVAHVGDSRAYLLREGRMQQLTRDHTVVAELLANNAISPEEAVHHPYKSVLSRNLGAKPETRVDLLDVTLQPGDRLLLCSDGLHGFASLEGVEQTMTGTDSPEGAAQDLIELALRGGGGDNVTAVVIEAGRKAIPRTTQILRTSGATSWWARREIFLKAAAQRGLAYSPICARLSPDEAVNIVGGNLCEAIFHDLEHTTGINVWTYAENLAKGWFEQNGGYEALRDLFDMMREAADAVLADIRSADPAIGSALDIAVTRSLIVAEMALGGILADRLRRVEQHLVHAHAQQASQKAAEVQRAGTFTDQVTMPYMQAVRVDPASPDVARFLESALGHARNRVAGQGEKPGAYDCLTRAHQAALRPTGATDAVLAAREIYGVRALEEAGVAPLFDALDQARLAHADAIRSLEVDREIKAAAMRRVVVAHRRMMFAIAQLVVEAGNPISEKFHEAVESTARLRGQVGKLEAKIAEMERDFHTRVDPNLQNIFGKQ